MTPSVSFAWIALRAIATALFGGSVLTNLVLEPNVESSYVRPGARLRFWVGFVMIMAAGIKGGSVARPLAR